MAEDQAPTPPFRFLEQDEGGTSPKIRVQDANRKIWMVKFGREAKPDVFGSRLARACGYWTPPTYFVAAGEVTELGDIYRASGYLRKGRFRDACFKLRQPTVRPAEDEHWTSQQNPFHGTKERNGLKILIVRGPTGTTKTRATVPAAPIPWCWNASLLTAAASFSTPLSTGGLHWGNGVVWLRAASGIATVSAGSMPGSFRAPARSRRAAPTLRKPSALHPRCGSESTVSGARRARP